MLSCVAGSRFLGRGAVEMDADLLAGARARGFGGMNMVFDRFSFPEDELEKIAAALQTFKKVGVQKRQVIALEIAMLGRSGLDINDPEDSTR